MFCNVCDYSLGHTSGNGVTKSKDMNILSYWVEYERIKS